MPADTAIIYVRQSTAKEESISLENQETSCRDYCTRQGYRVGEVIADEGISGRKWDKRPGIQRALTAVERGEATHVIVWRWSRLARRQVYQHLAIHRIESAGASVESAIEPFDTDTAGGMFGRDVMLASASFESQQKSEQWRDAHRYRVNNGLPSSGRERFGYTWKNTRGEQERYDIDECEADIVRWLYEEYNAGRGVASLVRELSRLGIMSKDGSEWERQKLTRYMESGFAAGYLVHTGEGTGERYHRVPFEKFEFLPAAHEPIISEETWQAFKAVKAGRAKTPPRSIEPTSPLSGVLQCGDCGGAMTRHVTKTRHGRKHAKFICATRNAGKPVRSCSMSEQRLTHVVLEWLRGVADNTGEAAERAAQQQQRHIESQADADAARRHVADIDSQLANLTKQLVAGRVPESAYEATRDELQTERARAEERRRIAESTAVESNETPPHQIATGLMQEWETLSVGTRNRLLKVLVRRVVVTPPEAQGGRSSAQVIAVWEGN